MRVFFRRRDRRMANASTHLRAALHGVMPLMHAAFAAVGNSPQPGSSLDQACLLDGDQVVEDYIRHGEQGLALDHLIYMVQEPPLNVSRDTFDHISAAATALGFPPERIDPIRPG